MVFALGLWSSCSNWFKFADYFGSHLITHETFLYFMVATAVLYLRFFPCVHTIHIYFGNMWFLKHDNKCHLSNIVNVFLKSDLSSPQLHPAWCRTFQETTTFRITNCWFQLCMWNAIFEASLIHTGTKTLL